MSLPSEAKLEARIAPGIALYDAAAVLPINATARKLYRKRSVEKIQYVIVHKSGADGPAGYRGMEGSAKYVMNNRGWEGFAYTFWLPRVPDIDGKGLEVAYRGNLDETRSFHTGGQMNTLGVGIGVQGNYDGDADGEIERHPTDFQIRALVGLVDYLEGRHELFHRLGKDDGDRFLLTGHWEHGKPVCPGDALVEWVRKERGESIALAASQVSAPHVSAGEVFPASFKKAQRQKALTLLGYPMGPIDGLWGYRSRAALEKFQTSQRIVADGVWGPHTSAAVLRALRCAGLNWILAFEQKKV